MVLNFPGTVCDLQGKFSVYIFLTTRILNIFAFDKYFQYFASLYILSICNLHLHKCSNISQIHNVLTCVNTFFRVDCFLHFFLFDDLEVGVYDTLCIPPVLESILPEK